jgi:hypothetical protein
MYAKKFLFDLIWDSKQLHFIEAQEQFISNTGYIRYNDVYRAE